MIHSNLPSRLRFHSSRTPILLGACLLGACSSNHPGGNGPSHWASKSADGVSRNLLMPDFIEDPLEPVNRGVWEVNRGLLAGVIEPTGRVYRRVVPSPVRGSITDFTRNITYPGRVVNHALQGRWEGAGDETKRFICNTTVGVGGIFDVASKWDMPKSNADFSQTFGTWGWKPQSFLMLPFLGPSDDRDLVGYAADKASEPWTYGVPYRYGSYVSSYNKITGRSEDALRISRSEFDSYALVKYAWTFASKDGPPDWSVTGPIDIPTMQTLGAVRVSYQNPDFMSNGRELRVRIPSTGKTLKFNYWLHPGTAPLVYISPGLSSHRLSLTTLSIAEHLHRNGYSVVTTTSVFHPEFMENASTSPLPVYAPRDSRDLLVAMTEADRVLVSKYPQRFTNKRALVGLSMGGFLTLRLAAYENEADPGLLKFDRYLAINAPVDVVEGALCVDSFQEAPMAWPAAKRQARLNNTLHKAAASGALIERPGTLPPFDGIESKYLIGLTFRITLRDIIYSSQTRQNMGVVQAPLTKWRREEAYHEIMKYSYKDYFLKMAVPYYRSQGVSMNQLTREGNLRTHASRLRKQGKIRLITNRNDFLLPSNDLSWLKSTFKPSQLTVFPDGGHLGNLGSPPVQSAVLKAMDGLK